MMTGPMTTGQQLVHEAHATSADDGRQDEIHEARGKQTEHGGGQAPGLGGIDDGAMKAKLEPRKIGT